MRKDGGPAFPFIPIDHGGFQEGMTLRDYFAAHAPADEIDGMVPNTVGDCAKFLGILKYEYESHYLLLLAKARYKWADAMLAERDK